MQCGVSYQTQGPSSGLHLSLFQFVFIEYSAHTLEIKLIEGVLEHSVTSSHLNSTQLPNAFLPSQ